MTLKDRDRTEISKLNSEINHLTHKVSELEILNRNLI